ncbi:MAG: carboxypeptidase regulatory-like domain-containing protein [Acidobacteriota bacterium]
MRILACLSAVVCLTSCSGSGPEPAPAASPLAAVDPATLGTITGRVMLDGTPPVAQIVSFDADPKCASLASGEQRTEYLLLDPDQSVRNVFVYVKEGLPPGLYPVPSAPAVLDQRQCRYVPRVIGVQVGQQIAIRNSDPLLHNVRADGAVNAPFDFGTPIQGMEIKRTFATREIMVPFKCNVHPWMHAYVGVLEHPFFSVTGEGGRFTLPRLPAGSYTVEIWHERLGTQTREVTVAAGATADVSFTLQVS